MSVCPSVSHGRSPDVDLTSKAGLPYPHKQKLRHREDSMTGSAWTTTANSSAVRALQTREARIISVFGRATVGDRNVNLSKTLL